MALFSTYSLQKPGNFNLWNRAHKFSGDNKVKLTVQKRIRKPVSETAAGAWATLNELLQNPLTTREIWLVLGNMLSAKTFYDGLSKARASSASTCLLWIAAKTCRLAKPCRTRC
ncbi:hypothetical protein ABIC03_005978 [Bradyrhizobium sp. RT6a]